MSRAYGRKVVSRLVTRVLGWIRRERMDGTTTHQEYKISEFGGIALLTYSSLLGYCNEGPRQKEHWRKNQKC